MKRILLMLLTCGAFAAHAQQVSFTVTQQPCNAGGIPDGVLTLNFTGLTPPITVNYYLGFGQTVTQTTNTTTDILNGYSGDYVSVSANDANNNWVNNDFSSPPFTYTVATTPAQCPNPGTATATVVGGLAPYTYEWYDKTTNAVLSTSNPASLSAGQIGVKITDANGCQMGTHLSEDSINIWNQQNFYPNIVTTPANCTNGTATITGVTGSGVPPYTYQWSNGASTTNITNLTMGYYTVTVTDAQGCTGSGGAYIDQVVIINGNVTATPATCLQSDGAVTAFGSGGVPPYTYTWSNGPTTQSQNGIPGGSYNVVVTDANGCIGNGSGYVMTTTPITVTTSSTPSSCTAPTGSATLAISGGTAPYTVTWSTFPAQTGTSITNMPAGTYSFSIVDAQGCVQSGSVAIQPQNIITASFSSVQPTCLASNGSLTVTPSGGATPYTYNWSTGSSSNMAAPLAAGSYSVVITDDDGCSITKSTYLSSYSPVSIGTSVTQASCIYTDDGSITANAFGGTAPYTYSWSNGGSGNTISGLADGGYWVNVTDAAGCTADKYNYVPYDASSNSCYCTVTGTVYEDLNNNCTQDAGEQGIQNIQMYLSGFGYDYTDANGVFSFKAHTGNYTLSQTVQTLYPLATCQNNSIAVSAVAASNCTQSFNFANTVTPLHDMHVSTWTYVPPVVGNTFETITILSNQGTVAESAIIGSKQSDVQIGAPTYLPSSVYNAGTNGYGNFAAGTLNLQPGDAQSVNTYYQIPTNIPMGTLLTFKDSVAYQGPITNWLTDYTPWDNVNYYNNTVVSSYDPNFKEVSPKGDGPDGKITVVDSVLEYNVHFQNLGTWQAQNIVVRDTLDADLDWKTLRPIFSSHPSTVSITEGGVLTYTFANINLPAEMYNEPGSHGMFTYSIKTKKNLPIGTQFTNSAAIYFDYNEPVITNTTVNTLTEPTSVGQVSGSKGTGMLAVYPNPAGSNFTAKVQAGDASELRVVDMQGRTVISTQLAASKEVRTVSVDATSLTPGVYFVNHIAGKNTKTEKLVIMK